MWYNYDLIDIIIDKQERPAQFAQFIDRNFVKITIIRSSHILCHITAV